ncbi:flagellar biosynthesis protein FlhF [Aliiglaciecola sp. M165]|uniref:flagellar biosynthesis protein FlhF n=1 Tax=Aliiglaciecola sp. M165 TaxID=2593649 RepID=UPI001180633B|nr:flagellar biosynthesis protein FlhF [Aliiglaciecola sp. M165]TRY29488.1 flagellar biosynthesis protein FlhF [Aliiglaciecola sp. M165]
MKIRRFIGRDMREALNMVKKELGGEAVIMSNKKVTDGIEIVAAYDSPAKPTLSRQETNQTGPAQDVMQSVKHRQASGTGSGAQSMATKKPIPSLSEIIGDSGPDSLRELLEKQNGQTTQQQLANGRNENNGHPSIAGQNQPLNNSVGTAHTAKAATDTNAQAMADIRSELHSLRNVLQFQISGLLKQEQNRHHPLHGYLTSRLEQMGISSKIANEVMSYTPADADERQAWLYLLKLLANRINTSGNAILNEQGAVALVGPTGTGKTTTIAKLAARAAQKYGADQVALVTIDSYRIAAYEQLATYGKIIGCAVKKAQNAQELSDILFQLRNKRLVLIDTAGFGQRDSRLIKQLDTLHQDSCANIKKYIVMQANTQHKVMEQTLNVFNHVALQGCIFTKLDECYSLGEAISAAIEHKLAVSYVTDGQRVPEDIKVADAKYLISTAAKLYKKYGLIHTEKREQDIPAMAV